jgi:hypothetical protein
MSFRGSWLASHDLSEERGFVDMAFGLFTSLFAMGVRFSLVLGVMLFIVSLGRDVQNVFSRHE